MQQNGKLNFFGTLPEYSVWLHWKAHTFPFFSCCCRRYKILYHLRQVVIVRKSIANIWIIQKLLSPGSIDYTTGAISATTPRSINLYLLTWNFIEFYKMNYVFIIGLLLCCCLFPLDRKVHLYGYSKIIPKHQIV